MGVPITHPHTRTHAHPHTLCETRHIYHSVQLSSTISQVGVPSYISLPRERSGVKPKVFDNNWFELPNDVWSRSNQSSLIIPFSRRASRSSLLVGVDVRNRSIMELIEEDDMGIS